MDSGVGGFFCYALQNVPDFLDEQKIDPKAVAALLGRPADSWHYENAERIRRKFFDSTPGPLRFGVALFEGAAYVPHQMSLELFARAIALKPGLITSHWNAIKKPDFYLSSLKNLHQAGAFVLPTLLSHNNQLNESDLKIMAEAGIGHCTCPDTECGMGLGPLLARKFTDLGGAASLGVDITCYVEASMLRQAQLMLQVERKTAAEESGGMPMNVGWSARSALELITINGARSIGMDAEIGSLKPGKRADLAVIRPQSNQAMSTFFDPISDPSAALLFYANAADIRTVMIAGNLLKRDGVLQGVDVAKVRAQTTQAVARVQARYNQLPHAELQGSWAGMF